MSLLVFVRPDLATGASSVNPKHAPAQWVGLGQVEEAVDEGVETVRQGVCVSILGRLVEVGGLERGLVRTVGVEARVVGRPVVGPEQFGGQSRLRRRIARFCQTASR